MYTRHVHAIDVYVTDGQQLTTDLVQQSIFRYVTEYLTYDCALRADTSYGLETFPTDGTMQIHYRLKRPKRFPLTENAMKTNCLRQILENNTGFRSGEGNGEKEIKREIKTNGVWIATLTAG